ncbi:MAG: formylglycine-generating enzyme family protein [Lentimicrobiaceae bacterium]|nr:formylglycine-generating enzyme family protein [Lentimicrobiaceae bacterium]
MKKVLIILCCVLALQSCNKDNTKNETINGFDINWTGDLGKKEKDAVRDMISNMVKVETGTFYMGAQKDSVEYYCYDEEATSLEGPVHEVTVSEFYINRYEVTQLLWEAIMGETPNDENDMQWEDEFGKGDNYPAYRISYDEVETFIGKLNEYTGLRFSLPTEAQWEYAAKGGKDTYYSLYAGGGNVLEVAWIDSNSDKCSEVGKKNANGLGLYDMSGNVWEMCQDWYYDYTEEAVTDPVGEEYNQGYKVFRGGSWNTNAQQARVTARYRQGIHYRDYNTGFRLVIE